MEQVNRAYNKVRRELAELGLLHDGIYLDNVELVVTNQKSKGEKGYVFESLGYYKELGFKKGVIYLPKDTPHKARQVGNTLCDTIRHEFAHAWYCLDADFFNKAWFCECFGAPYKEEKDTVYQRWRSNLKNNPLYIQAKSKCKTKKQIGMLYYNFMRNEFITDYAATNPSEDFAETFMFYMRYRNSLSRFYNRAGVQRKIIGIHNAIKNASNGLKRPNRYKKHPKAKIRWIINNFNS